MEGLTSGRHGHGAHGLRLELMASASLTSLQRRISRACRRSPSPWPLCFRAFHPTGRSSGARQRHTARLAMRFPRLFRTPLARD